MKTLTKILKPVVGVGLLVPTVCFVVTSCNNDESTTVVLYTNDVHTTIENTNNGLCYAKLKGYRNSLENNGTKTLLVDAGDFSSGGVYGTISKGSYLTKLLNVCHYDVVTPGNHEFDYGMPIFNELKYQLDCPLISSNFYNYDPINKVPTSRVLDDTKVLKVGKKKIGFVGISTPQTMTSANPTVFVDDEGKQIYTFLGGDDPTSFYAKVQSSIDFLSLQGVDVIIGLGHLGIDESQSVKHYSSENVIKNTHGLNALIDGHSHTVNESTIVKDSNNKDVLLTQTGTGFQNFGKLTIKNKTNELKAELINSTDVEEDPNVAYATSKIKEKSKEILDKKLGEIAFDLVIEENSKRIVRKKECNAGDFYADGLAYAATNDGEEKSPIGLINGGGVRSNVKKGDVTVGSIINLSPFANSICRLDVKGSVLRDALEYSVCRLKKDESVETNILQVSSRLQYTVDLNIESPVELENDEFKRVNPDKPARVTSIKVDGEAINLDNEYQIAGCSFILLDGGSGFNMFKKQKRHECPTMLDYDALSKYFVYAYQNNLLSQYQDIHGQGRIIFA